MGPHQVSGWRVTLVLPGDRGYQVLDARNRSPGDVLVMTAPADGRSLPGGGAALIEFTARGTTSRPVRSTFTEPAPQRPAGPGDSAAGRGASAGRAQAGRPRHEGWPFSWPDGGWAQGGWPSRGGWGSGWAPDDRAGHHHGRPRRPLTRAAGAPRAAGGVRPMTDRDTLEALSSQELHDRAVHRAVRRLDIGFLWQLLREIPEGEAVAGHTDQTAADVTQLSAMIDDAFGRRKPGRRGRAAPHLPGLPGKARRLSQDARAGTAGRGLGGDGRAGTAGRGRPGAARTTTSGRRAGRRAQRRCGGPGCHPAAG